MRILLTVAAVAVVALAMFLLVSCESPAAQRTEAQARLVNAEAQAYQQRQAADAAAAAERAAIREAARENGHQRAMETLPYVMSILGGGVLALVLVLVFWDLRRQPRATDPALMLYLERQRLEQAQLWRAIAHLDRRQLPVGHDREVIVYGDRRQ